MIWEQSVSIIVMLTKCSENNMVCEMGGGDGGGCGGDLRMYEIIL